jgi:ferrous iron transport protein B
MDGKKRECVILALAGNPNSGKTTMFNAITGARQHVGNYPGVTVERKEGDAVHRGARLHVIDLPGTYSLSAHSPDEKVARQVLLEERPDVVVQIVDAGNLERNLYLTVQLLEMKTPLVIALNMMDEVEKKGMKIDVKQLAALLGVPIVPTVGSREQGIGELLDRALEVAVSCRVSPVEARLGAELEKAVEAVKGAEPTRKGAGRFEPRWLAIKLIENDPEVIGWVIEAEGLQAVAKAREMQERLKSIMGDDPEILVADARYGWVHGAVAETVSLTEGHMPSLTDRVDTVLANRVLGLPIFLFFMWATFAVTFTLGAPLSDLVGKGFIWLGAEAGALLPEGMLKSLVIDGAIAGVGGVMVFLPNILLLFMMVSLMEDSGYMARAAFIVDRVMHLVGLHGKSFIPLFLGFGCNVPAIMGARVLENERDRITTIMVSPYISCSARLPVYVLLAGAFFPAKQAGTVIFAMYILGIAVAMVMARFLRVYVVKGPPTPFVMELPPYRLPTARAVVLHMFERGYMYVRKAGTIILSVSIIVWFLSNFPTQRHYSPEVAGALAAAGSVEKLPPGLRGKAQAERLAGTYAGRIGGVMAPVLGPAGLGNWKVAMSLFAGFVAKEIVVSTMGTLYSLGEAPNESPDLRAALRADPFFTPLRAFAMMVFVLLYTPCLASVAVARRELGSWKWTLVMVGSSLMVAYLLATATWWGGKLLGLG